MNDREWLSKADLEYTGIDRLPEEGLPVGNGRMGTLLWLDASALHMLMNRVDVFSSDESSTAFGPMDAGYSAGCGFVDVQLSNLTAPVFGPETRQRLNVAEGKATLTGAGVQVECFPCMIYLQIRDLFSGLPYSQGVEVARTYRNLYAAQGVELIFLYNNLPVAGATLPDDRYQTMLIGSRAAMLDTQSSPQRYAIADPLGESWTLLTLRDVSDLYLLRNSLRRTALWIVFGAGVLAALLCYRLAACAPTSPTSNGTSPTSPRTSSIPPIWAAKTSPSLPVAMSRMRGNSSR